MRHAFRLLRPGGVFSFMSGAGDPHSLALDRDAAIAAGFSPGDVNLTGHFYPMIPMCSTYPDCPPIDQDELMVLSRLTKPAWDPAQIYLKEDAARDEDKAGPDTPRGAAHIPTE